MLETYSLRGKDRLLLIFAAVLVCLPPILIEHGAGIREAAHAQSLREMIHAGNWLVPTVGGLPWLESPPLTQWLAYIAAKAFGVSNVLTAGRLAGLLPLVLATLWTASFAASCSGRRSGILAGFALLTTLGVAENVWHGGNVIWLVAAGSGFMKLLAGLESRLPAGSILPGQPNASVEARTTSIVSVMFVFTLLGLATMIAGPIAAFVTIFIPAAGHVLLRRGLSLKLSNPWVAGWILTAAIAAAWPVATSSLFANTSSTSFNTIGSRTGAQYSLSHFWQLAQMSLPWLPLVILGQWSIRHDAFAGNYSRERLLACWSISVPVAVLLVTPSNMSLALASAGAWSVSAAIGVERLAVRVFKELPMLETRHNRAVVQKFLAGCAAILTLSTVWSDLGGDSQHVDREILAEARAVAEQGQSLLVDMNLGDQAAVILFELDDLATPIHPQKVPASWENTVVISSESFQEQAIDEGYASRLSNGRSPRELVMVRIDRPTLPRATRIAAEPTSGRH
jgi:4-amino-4-deoxy-L-arabinose transferase-like glycosyltransferase